MVTCCAYGCTNRTSKKVRGITFHSFPSNPELREAWVLAVRREDFIPTQHSRLCSEHFTDDQKYHTSHSHSAQVRLKGDAIPTIFNFPPFMKKILAEKEEIEKTYKSKYEYADYLDAVSIESDNDSQNNELVGSGSEESYSDIVELSNSVESSENLLRTQSLTVNPHIHKSVVIAPESSEPHSSLFPLLTTTTSTTQHPKVVRYKPNSTLRKAPNTIIVKSTKDNVMPVKKPLVEDFKKRLKEKDDKIETYLKKIKLLQQSSRRYKNRLENLKHSIFTQLQKRKYLSSDSNFKIGSQGCLLDRNSIKICDSESEESEAEEEL